MQTQKEAAAAAAAEQEANGAVAAAAVCPRKSHCVSPSRRLTFFLLFCYRISTQKERTIWQEEEVTKVNNIICVDRERRKHTLCDRCSFAFPVPSLSIRFLALLVSH